MATPPRSTTPSGRCEPCGPGPKSSRSIPDHVGVLGFSAGGHLASTLDTHFDKGQPTADDPIARVSCRPDFAILIYPVISLSGPYSHGGSRSNLLGPEPDPKLVENLSNDTQVTAETPPTFLVGSGEDTAVPPENCVMFYMALRKAGVPAEMHLYQKGPHGKGLAPDVPGMRDWPSRLCRMAESQRLVGQVVTAMAWARPPAAR